VCSDCVSLAYQRVQKIDCMSPRPVLILGPLVDPVKDMLVKESPGKFSRCVLGTCLLVFNFNANAVKMIFCDLYNYTFMVLIFISTG